MRVLVIEDHQKIARVLQQALVQAGAEVVVADDGDTGLRHALEESFDAVVLDLTLPTCDGLEVLRGMRTQHRTTPVLILSARGDVEDRIRGLDLGADDYLPKPFVLQEVVARVRALARRNGTRGSEELAVADLTLDGARREARRGGRRLELPAREFRLLEYLVRARGRTCTPAELLENVWDYRAGYVPETNVLPVTIMRLRQKVDADFPVKLIETVFSEGYAIRVTP